MALLLMLLPAGVADAAKQPPSIVESWLSQSGARQFQRLIVIGISDNQETRHHFEDKFVSHLRGHGIDGVTSYSLVPDLQSIENRDQILTRIMEQRIDGAISVRLVPLNRSDEEAWSGNWAQGMERDFNLRMLIEETLPVEPSKAKRFGLEIAVWETEHRYRVWAGRTDGEKLKLLRESAGDLVQFTIIALKEAALL